ncbi:MAG: hypothetical protein IB616_04220 [Methanosarcinales archaeon]|nr:MAG: hypothetical protein IB616_04220 [Methanosarcinales archaeon]
MNDEWLKDLLKKPEMRAKIYLLFLVGQICAVLGIIIGAIMLLLHVLGVI